MENQDKNNRDSFWQAPTIVPNGNRQSTWREICDLLIGTGTQSAVMEKDALEIMMGGVDGFSGLRHSCLLDILRAWNQQRLRVDFNPGSWRLVQQLNRLQVDYQPPNMPPLG